MPTDEVIDRDHLERIDGGAARPVAGGLMLFGERLDWETVQVQLRVADPLEPALLDHVNA
jgi:hypothetical protein